MAECNDCPLGGECNAQDTCTIKNNPNNHVKKLIGVMSGKGGVGKSTISALLAKELNVMGYKVGVLDADITGPSIPRLMGIKDKRVTQNEMGLIPVKTDEGISVISLNLLLKDEQQPVIWRGPLIAGTVKQFWEEVFWGELDYLIIDLPPGTGDVALTVMQSIPISGMLIVSVPHDMVSMIVAKAVNMVKQLALKNIGIIQNMSYIICPDCDKKIKMFDSENLDSFYKDLGIDLIGELPMTKAISTVTDKGICIEDEQIMGTMADIAKSVIEKVKTKADES